MTISEIKLYIRKRNFSVLRAAAKLGFRHDIPKNESDEVWVELYDALKAFEKTIRIDKN